VEDRTLRKLIEKALREHQEEQGDITGYMLITFQDGEAMISGKASDGDEVAQQIISEIEEALLNPSCACDNEEDEIGRCAGHA
jgi:hypothetical protein